MSSIFLQIYNRNGSTQHYYHYLLGYLMPLCINWERVKTEHGNSIFNVRSCALMDRITKELNFNNLNIIDFDPSVIDSLDEYLKINYNNVIELNGYDFPTHYNTAMFSNFKNFVFERLSITKTASNKVLIIDRLPPDPFYLSDRSEYKNASAGTDRRSIPNMYAIKEAVETIFENVEFVTLEHMTLKQQVQLFNESKIIIAQHGASLANLIWANPDTTVIEIIPRPMLGLISVFDFFGDLCRVLNLTHQVVVQENYHSEIDVNYFMSELKKLLA